MTKIALLIGVSDYEQEPTLSSLPTAVKDVEAMQRVLQHKEMGNFDEVKTLVNPDLSKMQEAVENLFSGRLRDDLVLLFFSGHGVKDDSGRLYLTTAQTRKSVRGELVRSTAVPASFVNQMMSESRCKRQVLILDCCFSGAFAEDMTAKDDGTVDIRKQLGGEGRAVLTSSTATQYSFEQQGSDLSVYTNYIVEGIEKGAADSDNDGSISIDELHEYAFRKVQETAPAMKPEIYAVKEGFRIHVAKALVTDPKLRYRKEVEHFATRGEISTIGRSALDTWRDRLNLSAEAMAAIEAEVLRPYQEYRQNLRKYEQALQQATQAEGVVGEQTRQELKQLQRVLGLRDEDIAPVEQEAHSRQIVNQADNNVKKLAEQYAEALNHFRHGRWPESIQLLTEVTSQQADYEEAVIKLEEAHLQERLAELTTQAEALYVARSWTSLIQCLEAIRAIDPNYRNIGDRLSEARKQKRLAELYATASQRYREREWQTVINVFREIQALNQNFPDPENFQQSARQQLLREEQSNRERRLDDLYRRGIHYKEKGELHKALDVFTEITQTEPNYRDTKALLTQLQQRSNRGQALLTPLGVNVAGWLIALIIGGFDDRGRGNLAGSIGGFINGIAILLVAHSSISLNSSNSWKQIILFGLSGGMAGWLTWMILQSSSSGSSVESIIWFVKPMISCLIGAGALYFWHVERKNSRR